MTSTLGLVLFCAGTATAQAPVLRNVQKLNPPAMPGLCAGPAEKQPMKLPEDCCACRRADGENK